MRKHTLIFLLLLTARLSAAREKAESWLQIRSQNFTVVTNANEKTGRRLADQFERMRTVFHLAFPRVAVDNGSPIIVLAVKDEKDFRALEPAAYLAKGQLKLGGLFLRAPDKNYVLLRIDAEGDHPYAVIYHEYTHFLLSKGAEWLPLWLNEGLAQFYENTDIHEKDVALGQPSVENLELLREKKLLPLATLFTVDTNSPYYHEENKGSIFYAESWALTHYLVIKDFQEKKQSIADYGALLTKNVDTVTAATRVFGDLQQLQSALDRYTRQGVFMHLTMPAATAVNDAAFQAEALSPVQADSVRADFLAYNDRVADARPLLDRILQEDPKNVTAHETMGYLEFRAGHIEDARKWFEKAVKLDSQSYIAHYYFAAMSMSAGAGPSDDAEVERSLRAATRLNPSFAPAFNSLATFEGSRHRNLDEAHRMAVTAVQLDPSNVAFRVTAAQLLLEMERGNDALNILRAAAKVAKSPEDKAMVESSLTQTQSYITARERETQATEADAESTTRFVQEETVDPGPPVEDLPRGPHHFVVGRLQEVHCHDPVIEMAVTAKGKTLLLHSGNYYKIVFSALGFQPKAELNPCKDLEGTTAKVEYVDSMAKPGTGYVVEIEMHK
jgi:tetratricopeptide (TPR) repeat protein